MIYFQGVKAGFSGTHGKDEEWEYTFRSDNPGDRISDVTRHRLCPRIGRQHPELRHLWLKPGGLKVSQDSDSWSKWTVSVKWEALDDGEDPPEEEDQSTPPAEQPNFDPSVTVHFEEFTAPLQNGRPIVNSALEPYDPPPEVHRLNTIIRVARNLKTKDSLWKDVGELNNSVDKKGFTFRRGSYKVTAGPYESKFKFQVGEKLEYTDLKGKKGAYASLELQVVINPLTWQVLLLDAGSYFLSVDGKPISSRIEDDDWSLAPGTTKKPFLDEDGNPKIGLLNGQGIPASSQTFFNEYRGYAYTDKHASFFKRLTKGE